MWAAANDGSATSRRRRRRQDKRRRTNGGGGGKAQDDNAAYASEDVGSVDCDSDTSSDGERSTTESVPDESPSPDDDRRRTHQSSTTTQSDRDDDDDDDDDGAPQRSAMAAAMRRDKRKRKRKKKKKKKRSKNQQSEETPEATVARLKSSYSVAMAAVGALHRASRQCRVAAWKETGGKEDERVDEGGEMGKNRGRNELPRRHDIDGGNSETDKEVDVAMENEGTAENAPTAQEDAQNKDEGTNDENITAKEKQREAHSTCRRVAQAARTALEQSLLLDHILLAPVFLPGKKNKKGEKTNKLKAADSRVNYSAEHETASAWLDAWTGRPSPGTREISLRKWNKFGAAHRAAIERISYLALVNYADLLLCCRPRRERNEEGDTILDRGAVSCLDVVLDHPISLADDAPAPDHRPTTAEGATGDGGVESSRSRIEDVACDPHHSSPGCLWSDESDERTIRLALAAYCDASELDPTDPTLWFKLACAARALGRETDRRSTSRSAAVRPPRSYRALERLALERGTSSLPRGVPPNRLLTRALREMEDWDRRHATTVDRDDDAPRDAREGATETNDAAMDKEDDRRPMELAIHLPRYSWATLGRILMRACREGLSYGRSSPGGALHHIWSTNCKRLEDYDFGSPLISVMISPLLVTPPEVIGLVCEYLDEPTDIKRLTCTCRAMPSEVASARAKMAELKTLISMAKESGIDAVSLDDSTGEGVVKRDVVQGTDTNIPVGRGTGKTAKQRKPGCISAPRRERVSWRVRSKMISSGKQAERKAKRSSVEYSLLAGTLSCTAQNQYYTERLNTIIDWEKLPVVKICIQRQPTLSKAFIEPPAADKNAETSRQMNVDAFLAPTSLNAFISKWSRHNSGPKNFLETFLLHVSLNAGDVFETDTVDSLSSCVIDCYDMMVASNGRQHIAFTPWYGPQTFEKDGNPEPALQALAVNLLNAELRLKRCESHDIGSHEHQEDSDVLAFSVPNLLQFVSRMSLAEAANGTENGTELFFFQLRCRVLCLNSSYYLWIGRCSNDASISKDAEDFGLECLKEAITLFSECRRNGSEVIKTPHLESSSRRGDHWSVISAVTLSKYKEHLQSSSIVSRARQLFQEIQSEVKGKSRCEDNATAIVDADVKAKLASLGAELLERYNVDDDDRNVHSDVFQELLNDFVLLHEDHLHAPAVNIHSSSEHVPFWRGELHWGIIWTDIPSSKDASVMNLSKEGSRPSILKVLASSLIASDESSSCPSMFLIFSKMALTALLSRAQMLRSDSEERKRESMEDEFDVKKAFRRDQFMLLVVNFFTDKITDMIASDKDGEMHNATKAFLEGEEFLSIIFSSLNRSPSHQNGAVDDSTLQLHLIQSFSRLLLALRECQGLSMRNLHRIESVYFVALVKMFILQKHDIAELLLANDKRLKKWQSLMYTKADLIFSLANEIAEFLSLNPSSVNADDGSVNVSHLIKAITDLDGDESYSLQLSPLSQLSDVLVWFYKVLNRDTFDDLVRNKLMAPICSAIIALCGSPGISMTDEREEKCTLSISDYFDSDDSVNRLFRPEDAEEVEDQNNRRTLLRKLCQLVQCISLVFRSVNEKLMCQESSSTPLPSSRHGNFLPLVTVRVLSAMSDSIFQLFGESVWGNVYPYGGRDCGNKIDNNLGKAYLHLYGFSFSGAEDRTKSQAPESIKAATQLFRCIKRVYHDNRRSPPSTAFPTIEMALPPAKESKISKAIRAFLFDAERDTEMTNGLPDIEWVFKEAQDPTLTSHENQDNIIERLRRGICTELAKGPITNLDSTKKSPSDMDGQGLSEERESTQRHELGLDQKFKAILEDLCYNPRNIENWIVLSECCGFKAEYISDRLVPIQEAYDSAEFCLTTVSKRKSPLNMTLDELQKSQYEEFQELRRNWTPFIGNNLYVYMKYSWSNFSSLHACANDIGSTFANIQENNDCTETDGEKTDYLCWKEIESKFRDGNYVQWANSWAGLFVSALRTMRARALSVARSLTLAKKSHGGMHPSEVSEDLATALYSDLMASTVYGYPMHPQTLYEKRKVAERSLSALKESIQLSTSSDYTPKSQTICWEIQFMMGKCYEKIASTLREEMYSSYSTDGNHPCRLFETIMTDAIHSYSKAYAGAQKAEETSGGPEKSCIGGSSHGALECLYRLHASRFKVLISAIRCVREQCELAELEAFRIASVSWFDASNQSSSDGVRGKTWDVFADCVDALSHCRRVIPLFHRAAYRLAQAYSWAPAFHNPDCDLTLGSKQAVPATKSYRIRGLDTGSCAESAAVVMSALFEKRRTQLCAVWVTTSARPPPFEVLNDSLRKYDALRLKYIRAFIDCMLVCGRKDKVETLLNCATTSNHDLPGFYEASASLNGGDPGKHAKLSLLKGSGKGFVAKVKRTATSALAEMILKDLAVLKKNGVDNVGKMKLTQYFKSAYKLYARLNSSCEEAVEFTISNKPLIEVEAFCKCYLSIQAGYRISSIQFDDMDSDTLCSILKGAVSRAKDLSKQERNKDS